MQIEMTAEVILSQLGYIKNDSSIEQAKTMISNTTNFNKFAKHIISLNTHLKKMNAYVVLSNKTNYLKIKCDENDAQEILKEFEDEVLQWAKKYNIQLEKLNDKPIYYILGSM